MPSEMIQERPETFAPEAEKRNGASPKAAPAVPRTGKADFVVQRLQSLDAYRGLIMITLAFNGFGLAGTATNHLKAGDSPELWREVHHQFEHVEWTGCGYWDLIQPSFMFMVGVAMAFSYAKRKALGQSYAWMLGHAAWRSVPVRPTGRS
jgi:predicted acyltransferase